MNLRLRLRAEPDSSLTKTLPLLFLATGVAARGPLTVPMSVEFKVGSLRMSKTPVPTGTSFPTTIAAAGDLRGSI